MEMIKKYAPIVIIALVVVVGMKMWDKYQADKALGSASEEEATEE